jgi:hypothetical protein
MTPASPATKSRRQHAIHLPEIVLFGLCFLILWIGIGA